MKLATALAVLVFQFRQVGLHCTKLSIL